MQPALQPEGFSQLRYTLSANVIYNQRKWSYLKQFSSLLILESSCFRLLLCWNMFGLRFSTTEETELHIVKTASVRLFSDWTDSSTTSSDESRMDAAFLFNVIQMANFTIGATNGLARNDQQIWKQSNATARLPGILVLSSARTNSISNARWISDPENDEKAAMYMFCNRMPARVNRVSSLPLEGVAREGASW